MQYKFAPVASIVCSMLFIGCNSSISVNPLKTVDGSVQVETMDAGISLTSKGEPRGIASDPNVKTVAVWAYNSSETLVGGPSELTPDGGVFKGKLSVSETGLITFRATAEDSASVMLYKGWNTATVSTQGGSVTIAMGNALPGTLVINEIDYDQPGTDNGEFIELYNPGDNPLLLMNFAVVFVNGSNNTEYGRIDLGGGVLAAGGYLVITGSDMTAPPGALVIRFSQASDNIQNGSPDAVIILNTSTHEVVDTLTYEGCMHSVTIAEGTVDAAEGLGSSLMDSNSTAASLCRYPNGTDTNHNETDFILSANPTPGYANVP
jgi:hypothetical protein